MIAGTNWKILHMEQWHETSYNIILHHFDQRLLSLRRAWQCWGKSRNAKKSRLAQLWISHCRWSCKDGRREIQKFQNDSELGCWSLALLRWWCLYKPLATLRGMNKDDQDLQLVWWSRKIGSKGCQRRLSEIVANAKWTCVGRWHREHKQSAETILNMWIFTKTKQGWQEFLFYTLQKCLRDAAWTRNDRNMIITYKIIQVCPGTSWRYNSVQAEGPSKKDPGTWQTGPQLQRSKGLGKMPLTSLPYLAILWYLPWFFQFFQTDPSSKESEAFFLDKDVNCAELKVLRTSEDSCRLALGQHGSSCKGLVPHHARNLEKQSA